MRGKGERRGEERGGLTDDPLSHDFTSEVYRRNNGPIAYFSPTRGEGRGGGSGGRKRERGERVCATK